MTIRRIFAKKIFMKRFLIILAVVVLVAMNTEATAQKYEYKTWANDPIKAMQYTLPNGLQIWMSVNNDEPRIQTLIAFRAGAKHDPLETTGMAHYFEHMMFKGSQNFGTINWESEKIIIDAIEAQFEKYRTLTDSAERALVYHVIDSLSYEASKYAIPNEYQKMMSAIGSQNTNAFTSYDYTMYRENLPNNQLENWARINADRVAAPVLRLFHTEIETVYEEKNMSLTNDGRRVNETILEALFPYHAVGKHNVLGTREHLKNPSMTNLKKFYSDYYVPNNMAIILTGDFNPDEAVETIEKYFGSLKPGNVPEFDYALAACPIEPIVKEVVGLEAESVAIAFPISGDTTEEALLANIMTKMLSNGKAGLFDVNIIQKQKALSVAAYSSAMQEVGTIRFNGTPKSGQTLEELRHLMLQELEKIKMGEFEEWMLKAAIENTRYQIMVNNENMYSRAMGMAMGFIMGEDRERSINYLDRLSKITKQDIVDFTNERCRNNYVIVYKRKGDPKVERIAKPPITPIVINRDTISAFCAELQKNAENVKPIEPQFLDYSKDIIKGKIGKNIDLYYAQNTDNARFTLQYRFEMGDWGDKKMVLASSFLHYIGTSKYTNEEILAEFYKIACNYSVNVSNDRITVNLNGPSENFETAVILLEKAIKDCKARGESVLNDLVSDIIKNRENSKTSQRTNFSMLTDYARYGEKSPGKYILSPGKYILSESELKAVTSDELVQKIKQLFSYKHTAFYYGPLTLEEASKLLTKLHKVPAKLKAVPSMEKFIPLATEKNRLVFAHYNANQAYCANIIRSDKYNRSLMPVITLYNQYFSGSMGGITFQELREKRSLAYSSGALFGSPRDTTEGYFRNTGNIITQNDKVYTAFMAFDSLYNNMPLSEKSFELAKTKCLSDIRTSRAKHLSAAYRYLDDKKWGYDTDSRKIFFEALPKLTLKDIDDFRRTHLQDKPKTYIILGNENEIDFETLQQQFGEVEKVTPEQIFGY